jgi:hypothetical protein
VKEKFFPNGVFRLNLPFVGFGANFDASLACPNSKKLGRWKSNVVFSHFLQNETALLWNRRAKCLFSVIFYSHAGFVFFRRRFCWTTVSVVIR